MKSKIKKSDAQRLGHKFKELKRQEMKGEINQLSPSSLRVVS